jgi:TRAP transporter TAXI family solute receptor
MNRELGRFALLLGFSLSAANCTPASPAAAPVALRLVMPTPARSSQALLDFAKALETGDHSVRVAIKPSEGSVLVVSQLQQGKGDIGIAQSDVVYLAYRRGLKDHTPYTNLRGVAVGGLNRLVIYVRRHSAINRLEDLRGKRVAISPPGTAGELLTRILLSAAGLTYDDFELQVHQIRDMPQRFVPDQLDAMIMVGSFDPNEITDPLPPDLLRVISIDAALVKTVRSEYPFVRPATINWDDEHNRRHTFESVGADSLLITRKDVPEEVIYALTAATLRAVPRHNPFSIDPDLAPATPIPLHPGAARYYRELQLLR